MSEIGTNSSTIALTTRNSDGPTERKPLVRKTDVGGVDPGGPDTGAAVRDASAGRSEPEQGDDLSIQALAEGDPLEKAAEALRKFIPDVNALPNTKLRIDRHDETGQFVYQNIDNESGEIVRQFPPEDLLEFLAFYQELKGKVVDEEV